MTPEDVAVWTEAIPTRQSEPESGETQAVCHLTENPTTQP
jgi:hypothetical protein